MLAPGSMGKPTKSQSKLPESEYDLVDSSVEAIGEIEGLVTQTKNNDGSPKETMEMLATVCNIVGIFVPQFALVGAGLGLIASLQTTEQKEDPMITYLDQQFDAVNNKLEDILEKLDMIPLELCKARFDEKKDNYIGKFKTLLQIYKTQPTTRNLDRLKNQCKDRPPISYIGMWANSFDPESKIGDFTDCVGDFEKDANNRVLYFRKAYASKIMINIIEAAEYEGICEGFDLYSELGTDVATMEIKENKAVEDFFNKIKNGLNSVEKRMYGMGKNFVEEEWKSALKEYDGQCKNDPTCILKALKDDFYPDFKYATVGVKRTQGTFLDDVNYALSWSGWKIPQWRSFCIHHTADRVVVFIRSPVPTPKVTSGNSLNPRVTVSTQLVAQWKSSWCNGGKCFNAGKVRDQVNANDPGLFHQWSKRGVVYIKKKKEKKECVGFFCTKKHWVTKESASITLPDENDPIIDNFSLETYNEDGDWKYNYDIIGIYGEWPGTIGAGRDCGYEENSACSNLYCCSEDSNVCGAFGNSCKPDPYRWNAPSSSTRISSHGSTPYHDWDITSSPVTEPESSEPSSSPVDELLTEAPSCENGENLIFKILHTNSVEGEHSIGLKSVIQKVFM